MNVGKRRNNKKIHLEDVNKIIQLTNFMNSMQVRGPAEPRSFRPFYTKTDVKPRTPSEIPPHLSSSNQTPSKMSAQDQVKLSNFNDIFSLEGKVAVVTGGSRGLGLHAASGYIP